jgi:hypothetical protein
MATTTAQQIKTAMAKAFFASAWADQCEESQQAAIMSGRDIMDIMPAELDNAAVAAMQKLCAGMLANNWTSRYWPMLTPDKAIELCYKKALALVEQSGGGDRDCTPELFGHYLAMQALGHGVGLYDAFGKDVYSAIRVPSVEFSGCSLAKYYF